MNKPLIAMLLSGTILTRHLLMFFYIDIDIDLGLETIVFLYIPLLYCYILCFMLLVLSNAFLCY